MDKLAYKNAVNKVFMSVVIVVVVGILSSIFSAFIATGAAVDMTQAIVMGTSMPFTGILSVLILPILVICASIYQVICLGGLANAVHENDVPAVKKLRSAIILSIISSVIGLCIFLVILSGSLTAIATLSIVIGLACLVLSVIAYIFTLIAYSKLKASETFPGKDGAKLLFIAAIIALCCGVVSAIPFLGVIGGIGAIVAMVLQIVGWLKIKNSEVAE
ncbi:MAG: hypothetical protein J6S84_06975 [Bacteroidales bacterium]|nr:hypothetical protein [Bacteroidales bacterium]MBQ1653462.1 hypothetical protein [Bacteroidales bacterium]MBQ1695040.1 hypothetical protein [Bacteroidales bacterium]